MRLYIANVPDLNRAWLKSFPHLSGVKFPHKAGPSDLMLGVQYSHLHTEELKCFTLAHAHKPKFGSDHLFWISSVSMQLIFKMDSPVERSIQPVIVAYDTNLLTCKLVTSQVVEWPFLQIAETSVLSIIRVKPSITSGHSQLHVFVHTSISAFGAVVILAVPYTRCSRSLFDFSKGKSSPTSSEYHSMTGITHHHPVYLDGIKSNYLLSFSFKVKSDKCISFTKVSEFTCCLQHLRLNCVQHIFAQQNIFNM